MTRRLELVFEDRTEFRAEYQQNIVQGGAFIATTEPFELREAVEVELCLAFCNERITLEAEVVHCVPVELAGEHGAGVAVQFAEAAAELREQLEGFLYSEGHPEGGASAEDEIDTLDGLENDLVEFEPGDDPSEPEGNPAGPLVAGPAAPETPDLLFPNANERTTVARVTTPPDSAPEIQARLDEATAAISAAAGRPLEGGIAGTIEELGVASLVQMFGTAGACGTLTFVCADEVGVIGVESGKLRGAHAGTVQGTAAFARMLGWKTGLFHFHAELDGRLAAEDPVAIEGAILEAVHQIEESARAALPDVELEARLSIDAESLNGRALTTTEEAVVELAEAGFTIARLVDVIPESDRLVLEAVRNLIATGVATPSSD